MRSNRQYGPDPLEIPHRQITRSQAKQIKKTMQKLVQSTWTVMKTLSSKASRDLQVCNHHPYSQNKT